MLKVHFGEHPEVIYDTKTYFKYAIDDGWVTSDLAKRIIKDIDDSEVISGHLIISPVFGAMAPYYLSGGTKTLLLIYNEPENIFNASTCGDNCAKWLLEIGKEKDVTVVLYHIMDFDKRNTFEIYIENSNKIVHNMKEFVDEAVNYI